MTVGSSDLVYEWDDNFKMNEDSFFGSIFEGRYSDIDQIRIFRGSLDFLVIIRHVDGSNIGRYSLTQQEILNMPSSSEVRKDMVKAIL